MASLYKLCFLGYKQLTELACQVVDELPFHDCEIQIVDCVPETLPEIVSNMTTKGFEVFIAGASNAATFPRYSQAHMQEIFVRDIDYLTALKKASGFGGHIAIACHHFSRKLDLEKLTELSGIPADILSYEDSAELYDMIRDSDFDVIIGAAQVCDYASNHHRKSVLVYAGKDTVRQSFIKARSLAIELRKEQKQRVFFETLIRNLPLGIIGTDEEGRINVINPIARDYLNVTVNFARGRLLSDIAPNLSPDNLLEKGSKSPDSYKILNGIRFRCTQNRLVSSGQDIGLITTLRVDNSRQAEKSSYGAASGAAKWKELISFSDSMKRAISIGKKYASSPFPLALLGDVSAHRQIFAECIHTGGPWAQGPLIMVNLPQISANDAGRHLLGCSDPYAPHTGLIEMANHGTLVLKNVQDANPAVQDILLDVLANNRIVPTGGYEPIEVNVRFISIFDRPLPKDRIRGDLLERLCTLQIELPFLNERKDDLPMLFNSMLSNFYQPSFNISRYAKAAELLKLYSWPENMSELQAVAGRFAASLMNGAKVSPYTVQNIMIQAIGEEKLYQELARRHPCLSEQKPETDALRAAVNDMKRYLGYSNAAIAERLGLSRSSLWRVLKGNGTP